jgi:hypothetical protein
MDIAMSILSFGPLCLPPTLKAKPPADERRFQNTEAGMAAGAQRASGDKIKIWE